MPDHLNLPVVTMPRGAEEPPEVTRIEKDKKTWQIISSRPLWLSRGPWKPMEGRRAALMAILSCQVRGDGASHFGTIMVPGTA